MFNNNIYYSFQVQSREILVLLVLPLLDHLLLQRRHPLIAITRDIIIVLHMPPVLERAQALYLDIIEVLLYLLLPLDVGHYLLLVLVLLLPIRVFRSIRLVIIVIREAHSIIVVV